MKKIQEVIRLKNALDTEITRLRADPLYIDTVNEGEVRIKRLVNRRNTIDEILKNYIAIQWLLDDNFTDSDVLDASR